MLSAILHVPLASIFISDIDVSFRMRCISVTRINVSGDILKEVTFEI